MCENSQKKKIKVEGVLDLIYFAKTRFEKDEGSIPPPEVYIIQY